MILNDEQNKVVWNRVYNELKFHPECGDRNSETLFPPFVINKNFVVYGIENINADETEKNGFTYIQSIYKMYETR